MRRLLLPLALLSLLGLAACGGSVASPSQTASPPASQPSSAPVSQPAASDAAPSEPAGATVCAESTEAATAEVTIAGSSFGPDPIQARVGETISWTNRDQVPHSAVIGSACRTSTLRNGETGSLAFTEAGTYEYVCGIHPSMTGTVEISD